MDCKWTLRTAAIGMTALIILSKIYSASPDYLESKLHVSAYWGFIALFITFYAII